MQLETRHNYINHNKDMNIGADGLAWWSPSQVLATICCVCRVCVCAVWVCSSLKASNWYSSSES